MKKLLLGLFLGLLAVVHSTPVTTVTQVPVNNEDEVFREAMTDGFLVLTTETPETTTKASQQTESTSSPDNGSRDSSLTTESPKTNATVPASQQPESEETEGSAAGVTDYIWYGGSTTTTFTQEASSATESTTSMQEASDASESTTTTSMQEASDASESTTTTSMQEASDASESTTTTSLQEASDASESTTTTSMQEASDASESTTTTSMQEASDASESTTTTSMQEASDASESTTTTSMQEASDASESTTTTSMQEASDASESTTTTSMQEASDASESTTSTQEASSATESTTSEHPTKQPAQSTTVKASQEPFSDFVSDDSILGESEDAFSWLESSTPFTGTDSPASSVTPDSWAEDGDSILPATVDLLGSEWGSGMMDEPTISETGKGRLFNMANPEIVKNPEMVVEEKDPEQHKGHTTPGWIIIVGFVVGVAALVLLCLAIATRDKWNGPSQASAAKTEANPSNQQRGLEMETFLPREEPRENGKAAEYTVIPLDELSESYS